MMDPDRVAREKGIRIEYRISPFEAAHTNTVRITLVGKSGKTIVLKAISTGGGMFVVTEYNGFQLELRGDSYDLIILAGPDFEQRSMDSFSALFTGNEKINMLAGKDGTLIQVKSPRPFHKQIRETLAALDGVKHVSLTEPVLPVVSGNESEFPFTDGSSMLAFARDEKYSLGELGLLYESSRSGLSEEELMAKMKNLVHIIEGSIEKGLEGTSYTDRILHRQSHWIQKAEQEGTIHSGTLINRIIANITALMEAKSAMEVIVAVPTAGSCGTFGGTVKAFCDTNSAGDKQKVLAYFAGGLIGVFFAMGPGFSAEEHGCQVETGAAGCMAAAALADLSGGDCRQSMAAASMALQNSIGLICDPVADRVEVPCLGKNVTAGMNALAASTMALSGFDQVIPLDQVIQTVKKVGRALPASLCNSGKGGLAVTPRAKELKDMLASLDP
jgi:L-serine dehydratase